MKVRIEYLIHLLITFCLIIICNSCNQVDTPKPTEQDGASTENPLHDHTHSDVMAIPTEIVLADEKLPDITELNIIPLETLPDTFPYQMTRNNSDIWESLIIHATQDNELLDKLIPVTKSRALRISGYIAYLPPSVYRRHFEMRMWAKLHRQHPADPHLLFYYTKYAYRADEATREEKLAYIYLWERIKKLNNEQHIPLTSGLRKTYGLSQYYIDLGEYQKAIDNIKEQNARVDAVIEVGIDDDHKREGILDPRIIPELVSRMNEANKGDHK